MKTLLIIAATALLALPSCTENQRAKTFGGNADVELPAGTKLVDMTWKNENLWYATRPMREGEFPETTTMQEQSSFGMVEGTVTFIESAATK